MSVPPPEQHAAQAPGVPLLRSAVWIAIGALIAAAIVCVIWVLVGPQNGIVGRAFLTILLLAGFAGAALYDAHVAPQRPSWYVLLSMAGWVVALLAGAFKIWLPIDESTFLIYDNAFFRFIEFVAIVLVIRLALLHVRLFLRAHARHVTTFTRIIAIVTIVLVSVLAVMLLVPLTFPRELTYPELYWRFVVAVTILASVGTALIPLINALNVPRAPRQRVAPAGYAVQWPTYADGVTPLPVLPDGSPDWNAYYTGYPSMVSQAIAPVAPMAVAAPAPYEPEPSAPASSSAPQSHPPRAPEPRAPERSPYEGYPPPPPLPPKP